MRQYPLSAQAKEMFNQAEASQDPRFHFLAAVRMGKRGHAFLKQLVDEVDADEDEALRTRALLHLARSAPIALSEPLRCRGGAYRRGRSSNSLSRTDAATAWIDLAEAGVSVRALFADAAALCTDGAGSWGLAALASDRGCQYDFAAAEIAETGDSLSHAAAGVVGDVVAAMSNGAGHTRTFRRYWRHVRRCPPTRIVGVRVYLQSRTLGRGASGWRGRCCDRCHPSLDFQLATS